MKVDVSLYSLFCFKGEDDDESEPYLWTIMFALDGSTISQAGNNLVGTPQFFLSPGSHGNLGSSTQSGVTQKIPPAVGSWQLDVEPIALTNGTTTVQVPGVVGVIGRLFEENLTPNSAMEDGHQALNNLVRSNLTDFVTGLSLIEVAADVQNLVTTKGMSINDATVKVFTDKFAPVRKVLTDYAEPVVFEAIAKNLGFWGALGEAIDGDTPIDGFTHIWTMDDLAATSDGNAITITDFLGSTDGRDSAYNLHGMIWQGINITYTPAADSLPPGRYQVTGADQERGEFARWISHIGGSFADGSPWRISRDQGIDYLNAGDHSFFVKGADGSQAEVFVRSDDPHVGHPYLRTVSDASKADNLVSLPPTVAFVRHES
ncbi:MAG: DUF3892 domain-containing protein [Actinomycetota bacterium]|nr:DUF3892 domain-containing protein [Actinomycetota bacterium]MDQ2958380.1 DUF3892 domain-containing protein [Actinomycetota bacterium]